MNTLNCGRSSSARPMGPAASCGKKAVKRAKRDKSFSGWSLPRDTSMTYPSVWKVKKDIPTGRRMFRCGMRYGRRRLSKSSRKESLKKLKYLKTASSRMDRMMAKAAFLYFAQKKQMSVWISKRNVNRQLKAV